MLVDHSYRFVYNCFNRYMVECEFAVRCYACIVNYGFNRYMVECE